MLAQSSSALKALSRGRLNAKRSAGAFEELLGELDGLRRGVLAAREHLVGKVDRRRPENLVREPHGECARLGLVAVIDRVEQCRAYFRPVHGDALRRVHHSYTAGGVVARAAIF